MMEWKHVFRTDINIEIAKHTVELLATPTIQTPNSESTVCTWKQLRRCLQVRRDSDTRPSWHQGIPSSSQQAGMKNSSQLTFLEKKKQKVDASH